MIAPAGRKLGKYEILQKLGRGGMADVYLAQDTKLGDTVALKLIEHSADLDTRESIEAERCGAILQAHLAAIDEHVVRIFDSGDLDGYFFVAMEYVEGQDLAELMRGRPLEVEFAADVAIAVAETLQHAHTLEVALDGKNFHGIIHGDIKPKNIRINTHGDVRVLDFGIAKALSLSRRLTRNEFGSVPYASPERVDLGEVNVLSDLWSLGVTLYEMVTGLLPYRADSTERLESMIRSRIPPPPAPDPCPEPLRRILCKALATDPQTRYQTAREFSDSLRAFREGHPVGISDEDLAATRRTFRSAAVASPDDDGDATRRTFRPAADTDATRRTAPVRPVPAAGNGAAPARSPAHSNVFGNFMRVTGAIVLFFFLYGAWSIISSYRLYEKGQELARDIQTEQVTDPGQIWDKWTELSKGHPSSFLLRGPRKLVRDKFLAAAGEVIETYRNNDNQTIYQKDWERARLMAARALSVDPGDTARGDLRIAEGHLARINGTSHSSVPDLNRAVEKFNEAQGLLPKSPDPQLGLARVYVYGLRDIDRAYQALQRAAKLGYPLGKREKSLLADGYRARADRLWWDSRNVRGLPQEKDQIQRVADDYQRALQLYQEVAPYGASNDAIVRVEQSLESVNSRLVQLDAGTPASAPSAPDQHGSHS